MLSLRCIRDRAKRVWEAPSVHTACVTRCTPHPSNTRQSDSAPSERRFNEDRGVIILRLDTWYATNDAVTHMSSTCRSIRNYLPDRTDSTPSDLVDGHGRLAALTTNPVAAGITTCQPPTKPPCSSWHARASYRRTRPRVRNFPVDGERWSYANLTDAGSRHEPTIPRRRPCLNHVPT